MSAISTIQNWLGQGHRVQLGKTAETLKPSSWPPAAYDRAEVFASIVTRSGGPSAIVSDSDLAALQKMQSQWARWGTAVGTDGETGRCQLQREWEEKVESGASYDPFGFPSDTELTRRFALRSALVTEHFRHIAAEARPICVAILKRLPALAAKLEVSASAEEAAEKAQAEKRGMTWLASPWLRCLWQTGLEVERQLERVNRVDYGSELSPAAMLANCIVL